MHNHKSEITKQKKPSIQSRLMYSALKSMNFSERFFEKMLRKPARGNNRMAPRQFSKPIIVKESHIEGFQLLNLRTKKSTNRHIIVLHGGAYVAEAIKGHRHLCRQLVLKHNFKVSFIDYPLAPEYRASYTIKLVRKAFNKISEENPDDEFLLLGDSAGGGLVLALLQILKAEQHPRIPEKTVLLSPWLDVSMSNPEIADYQNKDVLLNISGLKACGKLYARNLDLKSPEVSPIYGNLNGLSNIKIFVSTHELFYPDCLLLKQKIDNATGSTTSLVIKEKLIHDWIVLPIPERRETINEIAEFFKQG